MQVGIAVQARSWEIDEQHWVGWWFPELTSPVERTYIISYRLDNAVRMTPDSRRALLWRVAPPDPLEPIWLATVQVRLPSSVDPAAVRLAAGGVPGTRDVRGSARGRRGTREDSDDHDLAMGRDGHVRCPV